MAYCGKLSAEEILRRKIITTFPLLFLSVVAFAAEPGGEKPNRPPDAKDILHAGDQCFYNNQFACASEKFSEYMRLEPGDSVGNWRAALSIYFSLRHAQQADTPRIVPDEAYGEVMRLLAEGHDKAGKQAHGGDLCFYTSIQANLDYLKALFEYGNDKGSPKDSFKRAIREAVEARREGCAYGIFVLGAAHYEIGGLPGITGFFERRYLNHLAGFGFDKGKGIAMVFSAAYKMRPEFAPDAWSLIFKIVAIEDRGTTRKYLTPEITDGIIAFAQEYPTNENVQKFSIVGKLPPNSRLTRAAP